MARLRLGTKAQRVLKFLLALGNRRIASTLASRGFTQGDLDEGWNLLRNLSTVKLDWIPLEALDPKLLAVLDEWENEWFPVARATLERHHPAVAKGVFLNLQQTDGIEVIESVGTFVARFKLLDDPQGKFGKEGEAAKALLQKRGLTPQVLGVAEGLLAQLKTVRPDTTLEPELQEQPDKEREDALWAWYLEWSQIARLVIKRRSLLRKLGFLSASGVPLSDDDEVEETDDAGAGEAQDDGDDAEQAGAEAAVAAKKKKEPEPA